ncbi:MAG: beta-ketoacyl synthase N-terminal-like domain-containing protein, partial [Mycobacterium sp.]|uniref:beta-ketoacyl synthase N-terminal-like domain-containing protein n=1 Tax=Mycobacterium sp. TaxID=1785 RepID=UPI003F97F3F2
MSEPLKAALRRLDMRPPNLPIVANVTGEFYPADADVDTMLDLLGRQVASPVRFIDGLRTLYAAGARVFVEVGPKRALHGFVEDVLGDDVLALFTNHPKTGDVASFNQALCGLYAAGLGFAPLSTAAADTPAEVTTAVDAAPVQGGMTAITTDRYAELGRLLVDVVERGLHAEPGTALSVTSSASAPAVSEPVVVTGAALGLPGVERVFDDANVARILEGQQFIDTIPHRLRRAMVDRHITRLVKRASGGPTFETIANEAEVIKLAGRGAPLDVVAEFGVDAARDAALDSTTRLAIGAGFDALRDAGIPLVMHYKTTTLGTQLPDRWGLPELMRDDTGVIFASAFPGLDNFASDLERYYIDRSNREQLTALEAVRVRMTGDEPAAAEVDRRIHELRHEIESHPYEFDRRFLFRCLSMGHSQFAEIIGARGPNTQINAACASTTQATALAEDWIRIGRCRRVIVVSADNASSDALLPWLASGFLASGAAATDDVVEEAATPFDLRRHGMILGMGAAAFVVETADAARERGLQPICEVLATVTANSAFHGTRLDVEHIGGVMENLLALAEARGVDRHVIAPSTMFVSHETYTPARGGSASAEIHALRRVFGPDADAVVITNTKGFTGHAMGAGVEDVVAIKSLETGLVPPVPNYKEPDPELGHLNLSTGGSYPVRYALRLGAGFGSQIAMTLMRWTPLPDGRHRLPDELGYEYRIVDRPAWQRWLTAAAGTADAQLEVVQHRLRIVDTGAPVQAAPAVAPTHAPTVQPAPVASALAPAPAPATAATPAAAPAAAAPAGDEVTDTVVGVVSQLTGYPAELLEVDLDLEADLGVDTVKQAEIFAAIREHYGVARDDNLKLRDFPTLTHVIGWIRDKTDTQAAPKKAPSDAAAGDLGPAAAPPTVKGDIVATDRVPRRVPVPALRPDLEACLPTGVELGAGTRVAVMPDHGGVGHALVSRLTRLGVEVLLLNPADDIDTVLADASFDGVYWLAALDDEGSLQDMDLPGWRKALRHRVRDLYLAMRRLWEQSPFLVVATRLGGYHGYDEAGATCPLGGAVTGFAKAYRRERPDALVKAVDFPVSRKTSALADALIDETLRDPGCVEVGYAGGRRWGVGLADRPFPAGDEAGDFAGQIVGADPVFVVTGAAGSIVSAITADLAAAFGGTFHLLDLTPAPDPADPDLARYASDRDGLMGEIADRLRARGERPKPVLIERELARLERLHSALAAMRAIEAAGASAHYHSVDLTDAAA